MVFCTIYKKPCYYYIYIEFPLILTHDWLIVESQRFPVDSFCSKLHNQAPQESQFAT